MWRVATLLGCSTFVGETDAKVMMGIAQGTDHVVEEKFGEQNFRVLSEMRFLAKIRVVIFDFGRVSRFFSEIWREFRF